MATFGEWISCAGIVPRCIGWRTLTQHSSPSRTKGQTPKGVAKKSLRAPFVGFTQPSKILKGAWQIAFNALLYEGYGWGQAPAPQNERLSLTKKSRSKKKRQEILAHFFLKKLSNEPFTNFRAHIIEDRYRDGNKPDGNTG